jgi:hypothetical protein
MNIRRFVRVPFYTRGLDDRIDNPNAGWKRRGIPLAN